MRPVRNPETAADVSRSPAVCARKPSPRKSPSGTPRRHSGPVRCSQRRGDAASRTTAASPNRHARKSATAMVSRVSLVMRKVDPHTTVAASRANRAGRWPGVARLTACALTVYISLLNVSRASVKFSSTVAISSSASCKW